MEEKKKLKPVVIIMAIFYLILGLANFIWGAAEGSRFYEFDNVLIKFIGMILIGSSIGAFYKLKAARVGFIVALSLSVIELFIGVPEGISMVEYIFMFVFAMIIYLPGLIYFSVSKEITK